MTKRLKLGLPFIALLMLCGSSAGAQDFMTLYKQTGWPMISYGLQDVDKVTFENGNMLVQQLGVPTAHDMNTVLSIKFTRDSKTAIEKTSLATEAVKIATTGSELRIKGTNEGNVAIYAVNGTMVYSNPTWRGSNISIAHLQRGIYIITINNQSFKFKK